MKICIVILMDDSDGTKQFMRDEMVKEIAKLDIDHMWIPSCTNWSIMTHLAHSVFSMKIQNTHQHQW